jgi:hypothetical protein
MVAWLISGLPLSALLTVEADIFSIRAMSLMVTCSMLLLIQAYKLKDSYQNW